MALRAQPATVGLGTRPPPAYNPPRDPTRTRREPRGRQRQRPGGGNAEAYQDLPEPPDRPQRRDAEDRARLRARPARPQRRRQDDVPPPRPRSAPADRRVGQGVR